MSESGFSETSAAERELLPPEPGKWPRWLLWLVLAGAALLVAWRVGFAPSTDHEANGKRSPAVGATLADLSLEPLTGDAMPVTAEALAGKVTLINFWGPWCGYCLQEFPELVEIEQHFREQKDFQFLSVSSNSDPHEQRGLAAQTEQFLKQQRATFPTYSDFRARTHMAVAIAAKLDSFGYPTTIVLDREGRIRGLWVGYRPSYMDQVRAVLEETLRGDPAPAKVASGA